MPAYNLGLQYKNIARWEESLKWCRLAHSLAPDDEAAAWNLGIAATALRDWPLARIGWRGCGIDVPDGQGEVELPSGLVPVRLNPSGDAEVVWAERLDPARARIVSIPFPESGYRCRDIVVNDGAAVGYRKHGEREIPVFNVLARWEPSAHRTFAVEVECPHAELDLSALEAAARAVDAEVEDWTTSAVVLCKACSEGLPHDQHDQDRPNPEARHRIAIAHPNEVAARKLVAEWALAQDPRVQVGKLELLLETA